MGSLATMPFLPPDFRRLRWRRLAFAAVVAVGVLATTARSGPVADVAGMFKSKFGSISSALRAGQTDVYVTGYAWHLPYAYSDEVRSRLNETTWGGGLGRSTVDDDGDRHGVFFVALQDSHRSPQFLVSYSWQRYFTPERPTSFGWGYMAFVFAREDVHGYAPVPALLPCASLRGRTWEVVGMFVPRVSEDIKGDVLFLFLRLSR